MRPYKTSLDIKETSLNTRNFINENMPVLWSIIKPFLPWIIGLHLLDIFVTMIFMPDSENGFSLGSLIATYFYTCFVITWHRVVIHGPDNFVTMNPFSPKKHEIVFMGMGILVGVTSIFSAFLAGFMSALIPVIGIIILIVTLGFLFFVGFRISFYFPAKAVDNSLSIKQAYKLSKGYFWSFSGTAIRAPLWVILKLIAYMIVGLLILIGVTAAMGGESFQQGNLLLNLFSGLYVIPILVYFYPILYAFGVTVLSNYYQHALQNKNVGDND